METSHKIVIALLAIIIMLSGANLGIAALGVSSSIEQPESVSQTEAPTSTETNADSQYTTAPSLHIDDVNAEVGARFVLEEGEGVFEVRAMDSDYGQDGVLKSLRLPSLILGKTTNFAWDQRDYKEIALSPNGEWLLLQGVAWEAAFWQVASVHDLGWTTTLNIEFDNETLAIDSVEWLTDSRLRVLEGCDLEPGHPELSPVWQNTCVSESISAEKPWNLKLMSKTVRR